MLILKRKEANLKKFVRFYAAKKFIKLCRFNFKKKKGTTFAERKTKEIKQ